MESTEVPTVCDSSAGPLTVGQLRERIAGLPDATPVVVECDYGFLHAMRCLAQRMTVVSRPEATLRVYGYPDQDQGQDTVMVDVVAII